MAVCTCEHSYVARPYSLFAIPRFTLCEQSLCAFWHAKHLRRRCVGAVPDSGTACVIGYDAQKAACRYRGADQTFLHRATFSQPTDALSEKLLSVEFNPLPGNLTGKRWSWWMIDCACTTPAPVRLLRESGPPKSTFALVGPPPI